MRLKGQTALITGSSRGLGRHAKDVAVPPFFLIPIYKENYRSHGTIS